MNSQRQKKSYVALLRSTPLLKNLIILNGEKTKMVQDLKEIVEWEACEYLIFSEYTSYYNNFYNNRLSLILIDIYNILIEIYDILKIL